MNEQEYHEKDVVSLAMVTTIIMHTDLDEDDIKELVASQKDSRSFQAIDFDDYVNKLPKQIITAWTLLISEANLSGGGVLSARQAWILYRDYDIGLRAIRLLAALVGMDVDEDGFWEYFKQSG